MCNIPCESGKTLNYLSKWKKDSKWQQTIFLKIWLYTCIFKNCNKSSPIPVNMGVQKPRGFSLFFPIANFRARGHSFFFLAFFVLENCRFTRFFITKILKCSSQKSSQNFKCSQKLAKNTRFYEIFLANKILALILKFPRVQNTRKLIAFLLSHV